MKHAVVLILLGALALSGAAQAPEETAKFPIESLSIRGNLHYSDEQVIAVSGLRLGLEANKETFEEAQRKLVASGAFESVAFQYAPSASGNGYDAVLEVAEIDQIYPIRFANIDEPENGLREWLRSQEPLFGDSIPGTDELIARFAGHIEKYLESRGKGEEIQGGVTMDRPGEMYILFHPAGALPVVAEVDFTGNEVLPTGMLREAMQGVAIGSRFTEGRFRLLLDSSVRPLYEARGRVAVAFPNFTTERARGDVNGLRVTVEVVEGDSYDFGRVTVDGTASMNQRLLEAAGLKEGDLANFRQVYLAVERINEAMGADGYMKTATEVERRLDEEKKIVDLVLHVNPGPQYRFGKLFIEGLDINAEHEARRIWGLTEGSTFQGGYPDFYLKTITEQGVFDNLRETRSRIDVHDDTLTVDVTLIFNPDPTKRIPSTLDDPFGRR